MIRIIFIILSLFCFLTTFSMSQDEGTQEGEPQESQEQTAETAQPPTTPPPQTLKDQPHYIYVSEKSPYIAVALSGILGFGIGNYYAEDNSTGIISTITETAGWGLFIASWIIIDDDNDGFMERSELKSDAMDGLETAFLISSLSVIVGSRIFGSITAASAANKFNEDLKKKFRYDTSLSPFFYANSDSKVIGLNFKF